MENLNYQVSSQESINVSSDFRARLALEINSNKIEQIEDKIESLETRLKLIEQSSYYEDVKNSITYFQANKEINNQFSLIDTLFIKIEYLDVFEMGYTIDEIEKIISSIYKNVIIIENLIRNQMFMDKPPVSGLSADQYLSVNTLFDQKAIA